MTNTNKKDLVKKVINEEVEKFSKLKSLELKKKTIQEALKSLESGKQLDEISWQGLKNAVGFGGKKAADLGNSAGKAVANKASEINKNIDNKVNAIGKKVGNKAAEIGDKFSTSYNSMQSNLKQFGQGLSNAATAGDIQALEVKMEKIFFDLQKMVSELNKKQIKLGIKPTTLRGILTRAANKYKSAPQIAENKKK